MLDVQSPAAKTSNSRAAESNGRKRISVCAGCHSEILDQYILRVAPDLEWHASCLRCVECGQMLDESCTCFVRHEKTYCKADYIRLFGAKCASCGLIFTEHDLVMRARSSIYHVDCFRCVACNRRLVQGDEFCLRDSGLFCRADHDLTDATPHSDASLLANDNDSNDVQLSVYNNNNNNNNNDAKNCDVSPSSNSTTRSTKTSPVTGTATGQGQGRVSGSRSHKSDHKTTRVRTVLNEKQLHTLRTCYGANPRPDALMKEQLVEMTGLSPRVIRVWFQNKRCKDKKRSILMKQIQQQQDKNEMCDTAELWLCQKGVPMVASSPVRHDPSVNGQLAPIEVHQYALPWKALADFPLQGPGDLDPRGPPPPSQAPPAFQQLVNSFGELSGDEDDETIVCFKESKVTRLRKVNSNDAQNDNAATRFAQLILHQQQQQQQLTQM